MLLYVNIILHGKGKEKLTVCSVASRSWCVQISRFISKEEEVESCLLYYVLMSNNTLNKKKVLFFAVIYSLNRNGLGYFKACRRRAKQNHLTFPTFIQPHFLSDGQTKEIWSNLHSYNTAYIGFKPITLHPRGKRTANLPCVCLFSLCVQYLLGSILFFLIS